MNKIAILVVDDTQANLAMAESQFKGKNVTLTCCNLFSVASEMIKQRKFDMLLTDLMMPGEADGTSADIGKDTPYGLVLSILAKTMGIPHVAIVTDINHHASPIAWAMDTLMDKSEFVSCFDFSQRDKNWLDVAERFITIEDASLSEDQQSATRKSIMLIGRDNTSRQKLEAELKDTFDVICVAIDSRKEACLMFAVHTPEITLVVGDFSETYASMENNIFKEIAAAKKPEQKILAAGHTPYSHADYLYLPLTAKDILEKVSA